MDDLDFTGKTAIITGGTKGLGRGMASRFLAAGADVVICARRPPEEPVAVDGRQALFVAADVRDPEQIAGVVAAAVERTGRVDTLVNNAGGAPPADSATVSPRFNEKIVALNLLAPMAFSQAGVPGDAEPGQRRGDPEHLLGVGHPPQPHGHRLRGGQGRAGEPE